MSYRLSNREATALEKACDETDFVEGDFFPIVKLGHGVGIKTVGTLIELGLLEQGYSNYYIEDNCYRITENGRLCLNGGVSDEEIAKSRSDGKLFYSPRVKHWPVTEKGEWK